MMWRILSAIAALSLLSACAKDGRKAGLMGQPIEPSINGVWKGNLSLNSHVSPLELSLTQSQINVTGNYTANDPNLSPTGQITGVTTGSTFSLQFQVHIGTCTPTLQAGGQNDG